MLTVIYCAQDKRKQAREHIELAKGENYVFASPNDQAVDHTATRVIIVGNHPSIGERYAGLAKVQTLELEESEPSDQDE